MIKSLSFKLWNPLLFSMVVAWCSFIGGPSHAYSILLPPLTPPFHVYQGQQQQQKQQQRKTSNFSRFLRLLLLEESFAAFHEQSRKAFVDSLGIWLEHDAVKKREDLAKDREILLKAIEDDPEKIDNEKIGPSYISIFSKMYGDEHPLTKQAKNYFQLDSRPDHKQMGKMARAYGDFASAYNDRLKGVSTFWKSSDQLTKVIDINQQAAEKLEKNEEVAQENKQIAKYYNRYLQHYQSAISPKGGGSAAAVSQLTSTLGDVNSVVSPAPPPCLPGEEHPDDDNGDKDDDSNSTASSVASRSPASSTASSHDTSSTVVSSASRASTSTLKSSSAPQSSKIPNSSAAPHPSATSTSSAAPHSSTKSISSAAPHSSASSKSSAAPHSSAMLKSTSTPHTSASQDTSSTVTSEKSSSPPSSTVTPEIGPIVPPRPDPIPFESSTQEIRSLQEVSQKFQTADLRDTWCVFDVDDTLLEDPSGPALNFAQSTEEDTDHKFADAKKEIEIISKEINDLLINLKIMSANYSSDDKQRANLRPFRDKKTATVLQDLVDKGCRPIILTLRGCGANFLTSEVLKFNGTAIFDTKHEEKNLSDITGQAENCYKNGIIHCFSKKKSEVLNAYIQSLDPAQRPKKIIFVDDDETKIADLKNYCAQDGTKIHYNGFHYSIKQNIFSGTERIRELEKWKKETIDFYNARLSELKRQKLLKDEREDQDKDRRTLEHRQNKITEYAQTIQQLAEKLRSSDDRIKEIAQLKINIFTKLNQHMTEALNLSLRTIAQLHQLPLEAAAKARVTLAKEAMDMLIKHDGALNYRNIEIILYQLDSMFVEHTHDSKLPSIRRTVEGLGFPPARPPIAVPPTVPPK